MAGHSPSKTGVNALMPGHPRLSPNVSAYIARPVRKAIRLRAFTPTAGLLANCEMFAGPGVAADTFASSENDIEPPYRR